MAGQANGRFVKDVTIPDDTPFFVGDPFTKTWVVQNNGTVPWTNGFFFVNVGGSPMSGQTRIPLLPAAPGDTVEISVEMTTPQQPGKHYSDWRFQDDKGNQFGDIIYVRILSKPRPVTKVVNNSYFAADVTIPDNSSMQPGESFTKTWRAKNSGSTPWGQGYTLTHVGGIPMTTTTSIPVPNTAPGAEVDLSIKMNAPPQPGTYHSDWQLRDASGQLFGAKFWLQIAVPSPAPAPAAKASSAPAVATAPAVPQPVAAPAPAAGGYPVSTLVSHLSQRDARWTNIPLANMGGAPSIGRWGCLMTCLTMTANFYGHAVTPDQYNLLMVQRGGFTNGYFTRWDALHVVYPDIVFDAKVEFGPALIGRIDASLQAGRPVTALVDLTPNTAYSDNDQHWVLILQRSGNDYLINDPWTLSPNMMSLMKQYGRPGGNLADAVRSGLFYHK